ncbi:helix-turn-helix domain-containing protein [Leucobacter soli]|uniref:helix-turn-helix domain-containing protein n=1 Tax=Leucobacter soli TaxID=2812850 RepID=UPI003606BE0F
MDELAHLGERLRAYRLGRDLTLEQLAARTAVSISTLSRLESGKRQASLELLLPITRSLGIGLDDLIRPQAPDPRVTGTAVRRDGMLIARLSPEGSPVQTYKITYPPGRSCRGCACTTATNGCTCSPAGCACAWANEIWC